MPQIRIDHQATSRPYKRQAAQLNPSSAQNAPNKEGGYAYMNAMLEKSAQENFAIDMGYNPTVTNATVAPDLQKRIGFTPDEEKRLVDLDYDYLAKKDSAMKEWWDKVFKA